MAMSPEEVALLAKLRALGWSQAEIADKLRVSQQTVAYQLRKLKELSMKNGPDQVFSKTLLAGMAGAAAGVSVVALFELLKHYQKE